MEILGLTLATTRNQTGASTVEARRHSHHATNHCSVRNYYYLYYTIRAENAVKFKLQS